MKILSVGAELFHVDGRTDMKKLTVTSPHSANAPKQKYIFNVQVTVHRDKFYNKTNYMY